MWIPITMLAALLQTARTAMQQRLRALLSVSGAGFVRYVYGAPLSLTAVGVGIAIGTRFPHVPARFWPIIAGAGVAQILGTVFLISAFDARDFAIGTVYSKTEVVQVAVFSLVFLGESLHPLSWVAVGVCMVGILILASYVSESEVGVYNAISRISVFTNITFLAFNILFSFQTLQINNINSVNVNRNYKPLNN